LQVRAILTLISNVVCELQVSDPSEAVLELRLLTFMPQTSSKRVNVYGVPDYIEDGPQPFSIRIGNCSSSDARYVFGEYRQLGQSWNEDVPFPDIASIEPAAASMVGQQVTISGKSLRNDTDVYVGDLLVSGPPVFRCVLHLDGAAYEVDPRFALPD